MSENEKIKIIENDNTSPSGSGTDSTDIPYIPGFSVLQNAPKNIPMLVTDIREFETLFGKTPRRLTHIDVKEYTSYGFVSGDYDRSYVYAKELLYQGMPVLYSNISSEDTYIETKSIAEDSVQFYVPDGEFDPKKESIDISEANGEISITAPSTLTKKFEKTVAISFKNKVTADSGKTTFEYMVAIKNAEDGSLVPIESTDIIVNEIMSEGRGPIHSHIEKLSSTQVEFSNSGDTENIHVPVIFYVPLSLSANEKVVIIVKQANKSVLDAFYKNDGNSLPIDKQWEVNGENSIADKSLYSVKYITSGGYPSVVSKDKTAKNVFAENMIKAAAYRGDAVALIDYQVSPDERLFTVGDTNSLYGKIHHLFDSLPDASYGTMMTPWSLYSCAATLGGANSTISMPASFGYLMCVAKAIKSSPNWLAMAGVSRGLVPNIKKLLVPSNVISNSVAEEMQPKFGVENHNISINTITNIRPYGLTLWGNRTLKPVSEEGTVALNFLNTRNMLSDVKKLLYTTAKSCMFEQNSADLWITFKSGIEPLLRRLKAGNGISDYQIIRGTTKYNGDPLTKGEIAAVVKIVPMYAVEYFELAVEINDEEVTVS